jgi:hypothetical protein
MEEREIVCQAIENLQKVTQINGEYSRSQALDGILRLHINGEDYKFEAEVKRELRAHQFEDIRRLRNLHPNLILVAKRLFPKVKEELRQLDIPYLEANGNFYFQRNGVHILIEANKAIKTNKETGNRAFTKTGLKVLFHFLLDKQLINHAQRRIASETGVALGNIPQVIAGLKETGNLLPLNHNHYVWESRKALLDRWITEYDTQLKPSLFKGRYRFRTDWNLVQLDPEDTLWGGEPAADRLTNHLRPEQITVYTKLTTQAMVRKYQLLPDARGNVQLYTAFWGDAFPIENATNDTVHPILIYADLMITGDKRSRETAEIIFNEHIRPLL